jgi:hypothetical protein
MKPTIILWCCLRDASIHTHSTQNPAKTVMKPNPYINGNSNPPMIIPWKCLQYGTDSSYLTKTQPQNAQKHTRTFAQVVSNLCGIPNSQLPQPVLKGDNYAIPIPEEEYDAGINEYKHNLHARIIWPKGSTSLTVFEV